MPKCDSSHYYDTKKQLCMHKSCKSTCPVGYKLGVRKWGCACDPIAQPIEVLATSPSVVNEHVPAHQLDTRSATPSVNVIVTQRQRPTTINMGGADAVTEALTKQAILDAAQREN